MKLGIILLKDNMNRINFCFTNHWITWKPWLEIEFFTIYIDNNEDYLCIAFTILNFEFIWDIE